MYRCFRDNKGQAHQSINLTLSKLEKNKPHPSHQLRPRVPGVSIKRSKPCYRCLGSHNSQKCPFMKERCIHCGTIGHTQRACRRREATPQVTEAGINAMEGDDSGESDKEFGNLYHVFDSKHKKPISLKIYLEGRPVTMELIQVQRCLSVMGCIWNTSVTFL